MKKTNIKLKGKLRRYLNWPLYLTIVLILMDVAMYAQDIQMGAEFYRFIRYHCTDIKQAEQTTSDQ